MRQPGLSGSGFSPLPRADIVLRQPHRPRLVRKPGGQCAESVLEVEGVPDRNRLGAIRRLTIEGTRASTSGRRRTTTGLPHVMGYPGDRPKRSVARGNGLGYQAKLFGESCRLPSLTWAPPLTSEALLQGLWSIKNDTLGGLTIASDLHGETNPLFPKSCWFNLVITNGEWQSPDGYRLRCT